MKYLEQKKKLRYALLIILIIAATLGLIAKNNATTKSYSESHIMMDTLIEITAYGPKREEAVQAAFDEFRRMESICDRFNPNSQVAKINEMAGIQKVTVDPDLIAMINHSIELSKKLDGSFDITVGALTDLWGIGHKDNFVPTQAEIDAVLPLVDYRLIEVDSVNNTVYLPKKGMKIDLGGVAKGYSINKASEALASFQIKSALINDGGDIRVIGNKPDGTPFRIGVQDPRKSDGMIATIPMLECDTLATSGDYQRFFEKDGIRYSHIIDPKTGKQPRAIASVTLVYKDSNVISDIPSLGMFVLGVEKGIEALKEFPGIEAMFVTTDGKIIVTPGLEGKIDIHSSANGE
jgi:thiamine biosynthesis lipoprotein